LLLIEQAEQLEKSHRAHAEKNLHQLELRRARLLVEGEALPEPEIEELSGLTTQAETTASDLKYKQEAFTQNESRLVEAQEVKRELARKVQVLEQEIIAGEARLNALERLQARLESSEALGGWFARHRLDSLPRLWQNIQIDKGWEDALEAVLRERLNSTRLGQLEDALQWIDDPPPAKCSLFESGRVGAQALKGAEAEKTLDEARDRNDWMPLQSYLTCNDTQTECALREWLSGIFAVESVRAGLSQRKWLSAGEMLVTPQGCVITSHSLTYYAPDSQLHGVLARQREIADIKIKMETRRASLSLEKFALDTAEDTCSELEASAAVLRHDIGQLQQLHHSAQLQVLKLTQLIERTHQRRRQIDSDLEEIAHQAEAESLRKREAEAKLAEHLAQIGSLQEEVRKKKLAREAAEQSLDAQRKLAQSASREMQEASFHEKTCRHKIAEVENSIRSIDRNIIEAKAHLEKLQAEQKGFDETELSGLLGERLTLREERERKLAEVRIALEDTNGELRLVEQERMASEQKLHPLREAINQTRLKEQEARIIEDQFGERLKGPEISEEELLRSLGRTRPSTLQVEISRLNTEIAALGAVNLGALDELQACEARKSYLDSQSQDLEEASETLKNAIRRIDRETRERLLETVDKVNGHLEQMFPTMFGGGQAKLILRGDEILDAGIQIFAQPPGKKNSSIHLLSGGEKALTALAFVFSLFQLNPAPFCLLDEVDAPLDDSNTGRFCNLVRKMSRYTQFVFISHNKITMEMAQQLIGITMQEKGVSRVVAVQIEEAMRLTDAAMVS
jgi:chromosome segregation protein